MLGASFLISVPGFPAVPQPRAPKTHAQVGKTPLKASEVLDLGPRWLEFGGRGVVPSTQVCSHQAIA